MGNSSSAAAAANESNTTFDEAMCKRFNAFYDVVPLPDGRVRPKFEGSEPPLALVAHLNYTSYKTDYINYVQRDQIKHEVHTDFINLFAQFEQFPTPLAGCLRDMNLKQLKQTNPVELNKVQTHDKKDTQAVSNLKITLIMCKLKFLGFIIEYVTTPVVLEWDKYMKEKQGQPLGLEDENDLSTLLQIKLLEGMDNMIKMTMGNVIVEYVATQEENEHYETFKNNLVELQQRMRNQRKQPQLQQSHQQQQQRDRIEEAIHPLGGGSKCKRRSKRRRQHKRQRSKKYCR